MGAEIDRLEVEIEASAKAANSQIEELAKKLESVAKVLNGINTKKLDSLANGLGKAQKEMNNSVNVKQADNLHKISKAFGVLSNGIEKSHKSIRSFLRLPEDSTQTVF